jgi:hypothetical protein
MYMLFELRQSCGKGKRATICQQARRGNFNRFSEFRVEFKTKSKMEVVK